MVLVDILSMQLLLQSNSSEIIKTSVLIYVGLKISDKNGKIFPRDVYLSIPRSCPPSSNINYSYLTFLDNGN